MPMERDTHGILVVILIGLILLLIIIAWDSDNED